MVIEYTLPLRVHPQEPEMLIDWRNIRTVSVLRQFLTEFEAYTPAKRKKTVEAMLALIEERRQTDLFHGITKETPAKAPAETFLKTKRGRRPSRR